MNRVFKTLFPQQSFKKHESFKSRVTKPFTMAALFGNTMRCKSSKNCITSATGLLVPMHRKQPSKQEAWQDASIPKPIDGSKVVPRQELEQLEKKVADQNAATLKQQQERDQLDEELQRLRGELERVRAEADQTPDTHDYSEAETRKYLIDVDLHRAGWPLDSPRDQEYEVRGMPNDQGIGYVDYVLWGDDGKPLAVVEAKKTTVDPAVGQQQAKLYADCLEEMHGQRPVIFYTNGYKTYLWDDTAYPPREVAGFYKKDELSSLILRRNRKQPLDTKNIKDEIVERYYQKRAIGSIAEQFENHDARHCLLWQRVQERLEQRLPLLISCNEPAG